MSVGERRWVEREKQTNKCHFLRFCHKFVKDGIISFMLWCVCVRISTRSATEPRSSTSVHSTTTPTELSAERRQTELIYYVGGRVWVVESLVDTDRFPLSCPRVQACCMHIIVDNWKPSLRLWKLARHGQTPLRRICRRMCGFVASSPSSQNSRKWDKSNEINQV